jgi:hypothetical protein
MRQPIKLGKLYGVPHRILHVCSTILYANVFQNPQIFQQTISLFPEHSTLVVICNFTKIDFTSEQIHRFLITHYTGENLSI